MTSTDPNQYELENQFILRLPKAPAQILRDSLRTGGGNLKDRLRIKLEQDMRHGALYFDNYVLPAKLVDLPCVIESMKTIDRKNVYKTADICQMLVCTEEEEIEEEPKQEKKKKDGTKVDKKYLFPHGITPPLKNVRKRRFRRTLKKRQYSDQPEIEKEVRRLFRMDYEAHHVSWEVIDEEDVKSGDGTDILMQGSKTNEVPTPANSNRRINAEHIFGEALSDSDIEDLGAAEEIDDESRISMDIDETDSKSDSMASYSQDSKSSFVTSFTQEMFNTSDSQSGSTKSKSHDKPARGRSSSSGGGGSEMSKSTLQSKLDRLKEELTEISIKRQLQETDLSAIDNFALRKRLEIEINKMLNDQNAKEREIREVESLLSNLQ